MNTTIIQVPVSKVLRDRAATKAEKMGFSSLQETIRVFLNKIASGDINIEFNETVQLSDKAIKRYDKMIDDIESGRAKTKSFTDVKSMMKYLNEG